MRSLVAGQNIESTQRALQFPLPRGADRVAALVLEMDGRANSGKALVAHGDSRIPGITWRDSVIHLDLDALAATSERVLCIAINDEARPMSLDCVLGDVTFAIPAVDTFPATVCFEVYRRGVGWKVRAVGQGYVGGLSELLLAHGITCEDAPPPVRPSDSTSSLGPKVDPLQQIWMIYEDAARITAAFRSARDFASSRLEDEMSAAVADISMRNTRAGDASAMEAQRRHDELSARARTDYDRDARYLMNELRELDDRLPPAMSSWKSRAWHRRPSPSSGLRIGSLTTELGPLTVPFCVPAPLRRPIWLEAMESAAAVPVVTALGLRLLAAAPRPAPTLDVIDLAGGLRSFWQPLSDRLARPVVSEVSEVKARLEELVIAADLAELRTSMDGHPSPASVVVFADFGFGLPPEALDDLMTLASKSGTGTSLILVGEDNWGGVDRRMRELSEVSQHIVVSDGQLLDPWTRNAWVFDPDAAPEPGHTVSELVGLSALNPIELDPA